VDGATLRTQLTADSTLIASQQARDATLAYGVTVTPSIIVDGRYLTTGEMIGRASRLAPLLDALLDLARASRDRTSP
jgi:hypothetical protein